MAARDQHLRGHRGNAFPLVGHDLGAVGGRDQCRFVVQCADHELADRSGGRVGRRIEEPEVETERLAGETQHPSELAAAEDRNERAGIRHHVFLSHPADLDLADQDPADQDGASWKVDRVS